MCREYGGYLWQLPTDIQQAEPRHPFVAMINHVHVGMKIMAIETLYHLCCCIREHRSLVVVAISMQAIYLKLVPKVCIYGILLLVEIFEIYKHSHRFTRNLPSANLHLKAVGQGIQLPIGKYL